MEVNLGRKAATLQRWDRKLNIAAIIKEIQDEHPRVTSEAKLVQLLVERAREDEETLTAAMEYAVHNTLSAQEGYVRREQARRPPSTPEQRQQRSEEIATAAKVAAQQILLLNQEMPNGKRMRFCTGEEMGKFGSGYTRIAKKVGKTKMVGAVLDEKAVRELMA